MSDAMAIDARDDGTRGPAGPSIGQLARFAWFYGSYRLAERRVEKVALPDELRGRMPDRKALVGSLFDLLRQDHANIANGVYPAPADWAPRPLSWLGKARAFFGDLAAVDARRHAPAGNREVLAADPAVVDGYPRYYAQNFHYQTDGYLSDKSASLYDYQVEVLFTGGADAMRRMAIPPLVDAFARTAKRSPSILDLACGTARTGQFLKDRWPRARLTAMDLSPFYLAEARRQLRRRSRVEFVCANGEAIPLPDDAMDAVVCVFTFHELPPKIRPIVAAEMARVVRPGGRVVLVDSLQRGDVPDFDALLEFFPIAYHEPYFTSYLDEDLERLFRQAGLLPRRVETAYLAKVCVFDKAG